MNKKVGIITLFHENYNYGAALQAYALQKAVINLGYPCDILDYERFCIDISDSSTISGKSRFLNKLRIQSKGDLINNIYHPFLNRLEEKYTSEINERKKNFKSFYQQYMSISQPYNYESIRFANKQYDIFITGSDQVWRPLSFDPNYYLKFAHDNKVCLSYAASLGVKSLSSLAANKMGKLIDELDRVSVRENGASELLKNVTDKNITFTVDPTLLHDVKMWNEIVKKPNKQPLGKFVFAYLIGENNTNRDIAKKIARQKKCNLVTIPGISRLLPYDFQYADQNITEAGPEEFLWLLKNAECVITDSFHACVFSILFKNNFYALERFNSNASNSMNGRIYDLLKLFSLENRIVRPNNIEKYDFSRSLKANMSLYNVQKKASWQYLEEALMLNKNTTSEFNAENEREIIAYAAVNKESSVRYDSSSGGIFYELAKYTIEQKGIVFGAQYDESWNVVHGYAENLSELRKFMGSKYVQSKIGNAFKIVKERLDGGKLVLFSGTPCQVAGLKAFLKRDYENLILVDFVCHGVPSPKAWKQYLHNIAAGKSIQAVSFRDKTEGWMNYSMKIRMKEGKEYRKTKDKDLFLKGFLANLCLRPSCYECHFKGLHHDSDITLADFWGVKEEIPEYFDDIGTSLVLIQTVRGNDFWKAIYEKFTSKQVDLSVIIRRNKNALISANRPVQREQIFKNGNIDFRTMKRYTKKPLYRRIGHEVKRFIKR